MKFPLVVLMLFHSISALHPKEKEWSQFKKFYRRRFHNNKEDLKRQEIFEKKFEQIQQHNENYKRGLVTYTVGVNQFSDYTEEELRPITHGLVVPLIEPAAFAIRVQRITAISYQSSTTVPDSLDWRSSNIVTPVKHQGACGSCWAFSAVGTLEAHYAKQYGTVAVLSEQQLVDCVSAAKGCAGGWMIDAYKYITSNDGITYESNYPYTAVQNVCHYNSSMSKVATKGYAFMTIPDENLLKIIVATQGPVSIALDASGDFVSYSGGIYYNPSCSDNTFTHAMVIVGYGHENSMDYWLIKNSWGKSWGDNGYIKIARNMGNNCGIASKASYPIF